MPPGQGRVNLTPSKGTSKVSGQDNKVVRAAANTLMRLSRAPQGAKNIQKNRVTDLGLGPRRQARGPAAKKAIVRLGVKEKIDLINVDRFVNDKNPKELKALLENMSQKYSPERMKAILNTEARSGKGLTNLQYAKDQASRRGGNDKDWNEIVNLLEQHTGVKEPPKEVAAKKEPEAKIPDKKSPAPVKAPQAAKGTQSQSAIQEFEKNFARTGEDFKESHKKLELAEPGTSIITKATITFKGEERDAFVLAFKNTPNETPSVVDLLFTISDDLKIHVHNPQTGELVIFDNIINDLGESLGFNKLNLLNKNEVPKSQVPHRTIASAGKAEKAEVEQVPPEAAPVANEKILPPLPERDYSPEWVQPPSAPIGKKTPEPSGRAGLLDAIRKFDQSKLTRASERSQTEIEKEVSEEDDFRAAILGRRGAIAGKKSSKKKKAPPQPNESPKSTTASISKAPSGPAVPPAPAAPAAPTTRAAPMGNLEEQIKAQRGQLKEAVIEERKEPSETTSMTSVLGGSPVLRRAAMLGEDFFGQEIDEEEWR